MGSSLHLLWNLRSQYFSRLSYLINFFINKIGENMNEILVLSDLISLCVSELWKCFVIWSTSRMCNLELMPKIKLLFVYFSHSLKLTLRVKLVKSFLRLIFQLFEFCIRSLVVLFCCLKYKFKLTEFCYCINNFFFVEFLRFN